MADTQRTRAALLALMADNSTGQVSAQDLRDFVVTVMPESFQFATDFWVQPQPGFLTTDKTGKGAIEYSQTAGTDMTFGAVLYKNSAGYWCTADCAVSAKSPVGAMAMDSYTSNDTDVQVMRRGLVYDSAWSVRWSEEVGRPVYLMSGLVGSISTQLQTSVLVVGYIEAYGYLRFDPTWAVVGV